MQKIGAEASDRWRHRLEVPAPVRRSDVIDLTASCSGLWLRFCWYRHCVLKQPKTELRWFQDLSLNHSDPTAKKKKKAF